jgi:hypothetical protein
MNKPVKTEKSSENGAMSWSKGRITRWLSKLLHCILSSLSLKVHEISLKIHANLLDVVVDWVQTYWKSIEDIEDIVILNYFFLKLK